MSAERIERAAGRLGAEHPAAFPATADEIERNPIVIRVPPNSILLHSGYELRWNWDNRGWECVHND